MALSRNERRKLRKERLKAKAERIQRAALAARQDEVKAIVLRNQLGPTYGCKTEGERKQALRAANDAAIEARALRGPLARMQVKPHLAREMTKDASTYRRMAMERWITSKPKSHK